MALNYNGVLYTDLAELETAIANLSQEQKQFIINDFNGISNEVVTNSVPAAVTSRQMHKALALTSKLSTIVDFINSLPDPNKTLIGIEFYQSNEFQRNNQILNQMAPQLNMTSVDLDQLFIFASTL